MLIAPRERKWPLRLAFALAVLAGAGGFAWLRFVRLAHHADTPVAAPHDSPTPAPEPPAPQPLAAEARALEFKTDALRGAGLSVAAWWEQIRSAAPNFVRAQPSNLIETLPPLILCDYEGDAALPLVDALDLLRYAGLAVTRARDGVFEIAWAGAAVQASDDLASATDPNSLTWGVFRPWRKLSVRLDGDLTTLGATASPANARALAWSLGGRRLNLENGGDGPLESARAEPLNAAEFNTILRVVAKLFLRSEFSADVAVGLGAVSSPANADDIRAVNMLRQGLDSTQPGAAVAAAWALGQSTSGEAVEGLTEAVETARDPALLTAALAALGRAELHGRRLTAAELGHEGWVWRDAAYKRLRVWLSKPENVELAKNDAPLDLSRAYVRLADAFGVGDCDAARAHRERIDIQLPRDVAKLAFAGPAWRRSTLPAPAAAELLRGNERRAVLAALWRWNRPGADEPTPVQMENDGATLAPLMENVLQHAPSATLRRYALEALYREGDRRAGARLPALLTAGAPALASFQHDPDPDVQRCAATVLARVAGVAELDVLRTLAAAHPPAGMDLVVQGAVQRFWMGAETADEQNAVLTGLIEALLASDDPHVAARAAWAKASDPALELDAKVRLVKSFKLPAQRAAALEALRQTHSAAALTPKLAAFLLADSVAEVRAAFFANEIPERVPAGIERLKLFFQGLDDADPSVRLAVLNSRASSTPVNREGVKELVQQLAVRDATEAVRTAAAEWLRKNGVAR